MRGGEEVSFWQWRDYYSGKRVYINIRVYPQILRKSKRNDHPLHQGIVLLFLTVNCLSSFLFLISSFRKIKGDFNNRKRMFVPTVSNVNKSLTSWLSQKTDVVVESSKKTGPVGYGCRRKEWRRVGRGEWVEETRSASTGDPRSITWLFFGSFRIPFQTPITKGIGIGKLIYEDTLQSETKMI